MNVGEVAAVTFALQAFVTLFVIMDPPGSIPIFLGLVSDKSPATRRKLAWQAAAVSMVVITSFALFGRLVLSYLNISLELSSVLSDQYDRTPLSPQNQQITDWTADSCTPFMIFS